MRIARDKRPGVYLGIFERLPIEVVPHCLTGRVTPYPEVNRQPAQSPDFCGLCEPSVARDSMTEAVSASAGEPVPQCRVRPASARRRPDGNLLLDNADAVIDAPRTTQMKPTTPRNRNSHDGSGA